MTEDPTQINLNLPIDSNFVTRNSESVTDFFGDNNEAYELLKSGGSSWSRLSLENSEMLDGEPDEQNLEDVGRAPLDPSKLVDRADQIVNFLNSNPKIKAELIEYLNERNVELEA